jgi:hypothetical protein
LRAPCVANLETAKELLEFGVVDEGAKTLLDLRHCAQAPGCEDWRNCSCTVEDVWRAAAEPALPEARAPERAPTLGPADSGAGRPEEDDLQGAAPGS